MAMSCNLDTELSSLFVKLLFDIKVSQHPNGSTLFASGGGGASGGGQQRLSNQAAAKQAPSGALDQGNLHVTSQQRPSLAAMVEAGAAAMNDIKKMLETATHPSKRRWTAHHHQGPFGVLGGFPIKTAPSLDEVLASPMVTSPAPSSSGQQLVKVAAPAGGLAGSGVAGVARSFFDVPLNGSSKSCSPLSS